MSVPNLMHIVQRVRDTGSWDFTTKAGLCAYGHAVKVALHAADPNFGELKKRESQNHCVDAIGRNVAVDVALYKSTGQIVDFIASAGFGTPPPDNPVIWSVGPSGEYQESDWLEPVMGEPDDPPPPPPPPPPDDVDLSVVIAKLDALQAALDTLNAKKPPEYTAPIPALGWPISMPAGTLVLKPR